MKAGKRASTLLLIIAILLVAAVSSGGCGGGAASPCDLAAQPAGGGDNGQTLGQNSRSIESIIAEIESYPIPADVEPDIFEQLKAELIRSLRARNSRKIASTPPSGERNRVSDLVISQPYTAYQLEWTYINTGDYNQNGLVEVADLTPIGQYFGMNSSNADWNLAQLADGDGNGEINVSDITPIGQNYGASVSGYEILGTNDANGTWDNLGQIEFADFNTPIPPPENESPVARITGQHYGITGFQMQFDASESYDPDGSIVDYKWRTSENPESITSTGTECSFAYTFAIAGNYTVWVTVTDNLGATAESSCSATILELSYDEDEYEPDDSLESARILEASSETVTEQHTLLPFMDEDWSVFDVPPYTELYYGVRSEKTSLDLVINYEAVNYHSNSSPSFDYGEYEYAGVVISNNVSTETAVRIMIESSSGSVGEYEAEYELRDPESSKAESSVIGVSIQSCSADDTPEHLSTLTNSKTTHTVTGPMRCYYGLDSLEYKYYKVVPYDMTGAKGVASALTWNLDMNGINLDHLLGSATVVQGQPVEFNLGDSELLIGTEHLIDGTVTLLYQVSLPEEMQPFAASTPFLISCDGNVPDEEIPLMYRQSGLSGSATHDEVDLVEIRPDSTRDYCFGFGWSEVDNGRLEKGFLYNPGSCYVVMDLESAKSASKAASSYGENFPRLTTQNPGPLNPGEDADPKLVNVVFLHGLDLVEDADFIAQSVGLKHISKHWWEYADPDEPLAALQPALDSSRLTPAQQGQIQPWWFYYNTVWDPIWGSDDASGNQLAAQIEEKIFNENQDATVILVGYSMGATVSQAAYNSLDQSERVLGLVTLNGVNCGTEWVNAAMTSAVPLFWLLPASEGTRELRSIYDFEMDSITVVEDASLGIKALVKALSFLDTRNTSLQLILDYNDVFDMSDRDDWFYPLGSHVYGGFNFSAGISDGLVDQVLMADRVFKNITYYNASGGIDASESALYGQLDYAMHDGIVPYHSQKAALISNSMLGSIAPDDRDHHVNHISVIDEQDSEALAALQEAIADLALKALDPGTYDPDDYEPDNERNTTSATQLSFTTTQQTQQHNLHSVSDKDYCYFSGSVGNTYELVVDTASTGFNLSATVVNASDVHQGTLTWDGATTYSLDFSPATAATYYLKIYSPSGYVGAYTLKYKLGSSGPQPPTIHSISPTSGLVNVSYQLSTSVSGDEPITLSWDLDGDSVFDITGYPNPDFMSSTVGEHTINVRADNAVGYDQKGFVFEVTDSAVAPVINSVAPTSGDEGAVVTFSANVTGTAPLSYMWNFAGGADPNVSYGASPQVTLQDDGTYNASLYVENSAGNDTFPFLLTVASAGTGITITGITPDPAEGDEGDELTFDVQFTGTQESVTYAWDFDGGIEGSNPAVKSPNVTIGSAGTYSCSVTVTNPYSSDTEPFTLTVNSNVLWERTLIDSGHTPWDTDSSLVVDAYDHPHISHTSYDDDDADLKYSWFDGVQWHFETVISEGNTGRDSSLAIDISGYAHISCYNSTNGDLVYSMQDSDGWHTFTIDSTGNVGLYTSIALDDSNYPHISYYDSTNDDLKYAWQDSSGWNICTVDSIGNVGYGSTAIALDQNNYAHICYQDYTDKDLKYAWQDGSGWNLYIVDSVGDVGGHASIVLDDSNYSHISYYDSTNGDLMYAWQNVSGWSFYIVDSDGDVGSNSAIALDNNNLPHITYRNEEDTCLMYAWFDGIQWSTEVVDNNWDMGGGGNSLDLDSAGHAHISYKEKNGWWDSKQWYVFRTQSP